MTTLARKFLSVFPGAAVLALISACGSDEPAATDDHTPVSYNVLINNIPASAPPYNFTVGQTAVVRLKLFNAAGDDLDDVEAEHFAAIAFNPADLMTVTRVPGHNYQFSVTGNTAGTGTMLVTYGHDEQADETTLDPSAVKVAGAGGPN